MRNLGACFGQQAMIIDSLNSDKVVNFIHIGGLYDESNGPYDKKSHATWLYGLMGSSISIPCCLC